MKKAGMFFLAVILAASLLSCSGPGRGIPAASAASKGDQWPDNIYTMHIGHAHGVSSTRHQALKAFKSMVEERTRGGVIVNIFPDGQLGTELSMHDEVRAGTLQGVWGGEFEMLPKLIIFTLPFLADNETEMERLLDSDFIRDICDDAKDKGVIVLGMGCGGGFRQFSNNVRPIRTPEDMKGLKMRANDMDTISRTMRALGADVSRVSYNDLYASLKSGGVDGQENPWINIVSMHFYEVQKYFTEINYQFHPNPFYVNLEWYQSLPEEYRQIIGESSETMMKLERRYDKENKEKALETIKAYSEVYVLSADEKKAFRDKVKTVYDEYLAEGLVTQAELDRMYRIMEGGS